ncbi:MAG: ATP-binding protein [Prevotella sp.]|nr:ATP-binding protein [Prevotella sp.]
MSEQLKIRPYARLLTMLGDQLIKNEQIAVTELMKNSYDADADWVKVTFVGFGDNWKVLPESKIVIEDNGIGMTKDVISESWMNPATPNKVERERTAKKQRIIQGEKGIGRYAMLKLGRKVELITRSENKKEQNVEYSVSLDLSDYDDNFFVDGKDGKEGLFLDTLQFELISTSPSVFVGNDVVVNNILFEGTKNTHGTRIEISKLRGKWSQRKVEDVKESILRFGSLFDEIILGESSRDKSSAGENMTVGLYRDDENITGDDKTEQTFLGNLFDTKTVIRITEGRYYSDLQEICFKENDCPKTLSVTGADFRGQRIYKKHFGEGDKVRAVSDFGDFEFDFYIFDFNAKDTKYALSEEAKKIIREHRIYLLRDGIRVLPYGDSTDDWLQIDISRGTISAGSFFSNDQIVGRVKITKTGNPHLKDKTNREGLIDDEDYTSDFICIIQSFLSYLRTQSYKIYLEKEKKQKDIDVVKARRVEKEINDLKDYFKENRKAKELLGQLEKTYKVERKYLLERAQRTEALAAVGLSVETASHDIMLMYGRGIDTLSRLLKASQSPEFDCHSAFDELTKLYGMFIYVKNQLSDMQKLFVSSKQSRKNIRVKDMLDKVISIYNNSLKDNSIRINVSEIGSPLIARCTMAEVLQVLINLIDNSIYWLNTIDREDKTILVTLDGNSTQMIFSDNGPGVRDDDKAYIFEPFFSGKGSEGRGLGLYIIRSILSNNDYSIHLADIHQEKKLSGANFVVSFMKDSEDGY